MQADLMTLLASENGFYVHLGVFIMLFLGGLGFPIPEDLPVLLGGVAASKQIVNIQSIFLTCYIGVLIGDQIMYFVGYKFGHKLLNAGKKSPFFPQITDEKIEEIRDGLRRRRLTYIFLGRHLFPLRTVTFITAGAVRIPFIEFLAADALAACVSVMLMLGLGVFLGHKLTPDRIETIAHELHTVILVIVGLTVVAFIGYRVFRKRKRAARATAVSNSEVNAQEPL